MILAAIGFFAYRFSNTGASFYQFGPQAFPVQAADWIEGHPLRGNMFNDFNWGGYLLYRLWPNQRVFVDSQSDFYGEELTRQYADILGGNGDWEAQLSRYDVDWIIVPPKASLAEKARTSQDWQIDYEDTMAVIFVRK